MNITEPTHDLFEDQLAEEFALYNGLASHSSYNDVMTSLFAIDFDRNETNN